MTAKLAKTHWKKNPIAFSPEGAAPTSWWITSEVQTDRAAFAEQIAQREADRLSKRSTSTFTHDKFPNKQKHP